ncbi:hypothetical protein PanWU01x14_096160, partial [Parasponia andersonii]
ISLLDLERSYWGHLVLMVGDFPMLQVPKETSTAPPQVPREVSSWVALDAACPRSLKLDCSS